MFAVTRLARNTVTRIKSSSPSKSPHDLPKPTATAGSRLRTPKRPPPTAIVMSLMGALELIARRFPMPMAMSASLMSRLQVRNSRGHLKRLVVFLSQNATVKDYSRHTPTPMTKAAPKCRRRASLPVEKLAKGQFPGEEAGTQDVSDAGSV